MVICSVCNTKNDEYATICTKCGGFLQNRVANLDLFDTLWRTIENPRKAFRMIALAEHKNYALFLYVLSGISITFFGFWYFRLGERFESVPSTIVWALLIGVPLGAVLCLVVSFFHWILSRAAGGKSTFRISMGVTSYSLMPIIVSLVLLLPIELMTFGMYIFTFNPHPYAVKPLSYVVLIGLNVLLIIWTFLLAIIGTKTAGQINTFKSILIAALLYMIVIGGFLYCGTYL